MILKNKLVFLELNDLIGGQINTLIVDSQRLIWFPFSSEDYMETHQLAGNPFMHPWANRLESNQIMLNNESIDLNEFSISRDANQLPLHGLLLKETNWITEMVTPTKAIQTFHFNEAFSNFKAFPFQHTIQITYELTDNGVIIQTAIKNISNKIMPISFGFHPYFTIEGDRKNVYLNFDVESLIETNEFLIPTTKTLPLPFEWSDFNGCLLEELSFDHGFFVSKDRHPAQCCFKDDKKQVTVKFHKGYHVMVFYAPKNPAKPYLCIEPMVTPTNALLSNHPMFAAPKIKPDETYLAIFEISAMKHIVPRQP
ncbi:MAG: aldose 1-epimerase [Chitinophagales bacterium]|nr:aldose 1-epimerase [Chitinophagales bacterium]